MYLCKKTGRVFEKQQSFINHIRHVYKGIPTHKVYLIENELTECPKCVYCDKDAKFISMFLGYSNTCRSKDCLYKQTCEVNIKIADNLVLGIVGYDDIILQNKELFIGAFLKNEIIDPYDGYIHKTTRFITHRSPSSLEDIRFYENRICIVCGHDFLCNFIKNSNKQCCSPKCECLNNLKSARIGHGIYFRYNNDKMQSDVDDIVIMTNTEFSYHLTQNKISLTTTKRNILKNKDIFKYYIYMSYNRNGEIYYDEKSKLYCNIVENRHSKINLTLKLLVLNGLLELDNYINLVGECSVCGCECELDFNFRVDENFEFISNNRSQFLYCSQDCYFNFLKSGDKFKRYIYREETKISQSLLLKQKILSGEFTPTATNSWCYSKIEFDGYEFRSSWEFIFYIYAIDNYNLVQFENIRIPYYDSIMEKDRIYIVDFMLDNKILVEVKPTSVFENFEDKHNALIKYAEENNLDIILCDDDYFYSILSEELFQKIELLQVSDDLKRKVLRYRKFINEN